MWVLLCIEGGEPTSSLACSHLFWGLSESMLRRAVGKKVHTMKPGLLASLLQDTNLIAQRVARLKELLPHTNVSAMASKLPEVLLQVQTLKLHPTSNLTSSL